MESGRYEAEEIACALVNIAPDDVVLELGAARAIQRGPLPQEGRRLGLR